MNINPIEHPPFTWKGKTLMEAMLVQGRDFDQEGAQWPFERLVEINGLFQFSQIKNRIPINEKTMYRWMVNNSFVNVFFAVPKNVRVQWLIDLKEFVRQYNGRFHSVNPGPNPEDDI